MTLPLTATETLALAQAAQRNRSHYNRLRARRDAGAPDYLVLTAANERQAAAYRLELAERSRFFPARMRWLVVPDPEGQRIGSGGATLHALRAVAREIWHTERELLQGTASASDLFLGRRVLILHSGGDSRRLPHCAASGKVFAELPVESVDGRASTLFDELFTSLACVLERLGPGLLVASGDVLLVFGANAVRPAARGVTGCAIPAPAEQAVHHGVYNCSRGGSVRAFLHKVSEEALREGGALDALGRAWIDTGLVAFAGEGLAALADLAGIRRGAAGPSLRGSILPAGCGIALDLYDDILPALSPGEKAEYLAHAPERRALRERVWARFHGLPFQAQRFWPAQFIHLGTTAEYQEAIAEGGPIRELLVSRPVLRAHLAPELRADGAVITSSDLGGAQGEVGAGAIVQGTRVAGSLSLAPGSLLSGLQARAERLELRPGVVLHQVPIRFPADYPAPERRGASAFATYLFGVADNPKGLLLEGTCTFFGQPADAWLADRQIPPDAIWGSVPPRERCLWNARLFPVTDRSEDLLPALWLQEERPPLPEERARWETAIRLSLADMAGLADCEALVASRRRLQEDLAAAELRQALAADVPAAEIAARSDLPSGAQCARAALDRLAAESPPLLRARAQVVHARLLDALAQRQETLPAALLMRRQADLREEEAFAAVRAALGPAALEESEARMAIAPGEEVSVALPVRIDFGGGWSDTPPYSFERGGTVLNAAVLLQGQRPVRATVRALPSCEIRLHARDLGCQTALTRRGEALAYQDPSDPFALHKAALVLAGIVRPGRGSLRASLARFGGGVEVITESRVPNGSGLGTSSILGACLVAALRQLRGLPAPPDALFADVLALEQILTTGGGWQDQVGGILPGIKLVTSGPGVPQKLSAERVLPDDATLRALHERLVLVYVGHRRLAKNILRTIMARYLARDEDVVRILARIQEIALAMRDALLAGDLDAFGTLMQEHWELNKRLDPNSTNRHVEAVLAAAAPHAAGFKMVGAGGGGFAEILARDAGAAPHIGAAVAPAGGQVYPWSLAAETGF